MPINPQHIITSTTESSKSSQSASALVPTPPMPTYMHPVRQVLNWFLSGLIILLPFGATLILLGWAFNFLDRLVGSQSFFAPLWQTLFGWFTFGQIFSVLLAYLFIFFIVVLVGYFTRGYAKQKLIKFLRAFFSRIPIVNKIYNSVEQLVDLWAKKEQGEELTKMGEVVMVQFMNVKVFGVLSSRNRYQMNGNEYFLVYLPSAPIPATGFTYFFNVDEVFLCDFKMDEMTKVVVSLGALGKQVLGRNIPLRSVPQLSKKASITSEKKSELKE